MPTEKPLVNRNYKLEKYPGKGGWTYVEITEDLSSQKARFGTVKVKGKVDDYAFKDYKLMPMKNGNLFFPIKAEIRKKIGKEAGDNVNVVLYADNQPTEIPEELMLCFLDDQFAHQTFLSYTEGQQKEFIDWINEAKRVETKVNRIAKTLNKLAEGKKFRDRE